MIKKEIKIENNNIQYDSWDDIKLPIYESNGLFINFNEEKNE